MANATDDLRNLDPNTLKQLADFVTQFKALQGMSQFGGAGMGTQPPPGGIFQVPVGGPGQPVGPMAAPSGVLFGGGSPVPINFGPARLQNTLVAIRDLLNASNQFGQSDIGKALGAKIGELLGGSK